MKIQKCKDLKGISLVVYMNSRPRVGGEKQFDMAELLLVTFSA